MPSMGVFKHLFKELYEWLLHSVDVITQHLVAIALKISVVKYLIKELHDRFIYFIDLLAQHFIIVALSSFLVLVFGVLIGVFVFYNSKARAFLLPVVNFLYTIPSLALFALFIPLIGVYKCYYFSYFFKYSMTFSKNFGLSLNLPSPVLQLSQIHSLPQPVS